MLLSRSSLLALALALAAGVAPRALTPLRATRAELRHELPGGPAAKALAGVGPETQPVALASLFEAEAAWLLRSPAGLAAPAPEAASWTAWGGWLAALRRGDADRRARLGLGLIALRESRWEDAWRVVAAAGGDPAEVAALVPHLLPGASLEHPAVAGGAPPALPDGVLLRPAPPPLPELHGPGLAAPGGVLPRRASVSGFRVGDALLSLEIAVEPAGVQVDLRHLSGGRAHVSVLLPEVEGQEIRVEYIDWMRQDVRRGPLAVELVPGGEAVVLFGRFLPRDPVLPASPRGELPRSIAEGGIWIEVAAGSGLELPRAAADALGLALGVPAGLRQPLDPPPPGAYSGVVLHYAGVEEGARMLDRVASAAEAHVLR